MYMPRYVDIERSKDMITTFGGYNANLSCQDGEFKDMKNMSSSFYPVLSPRSKRGNVYQTTDPKYLIDKEDMYWIDGTTLYKNGTAVPLEDKNGNSFELSEGEKSIFKFGVNICIVPDNIYYNTKTGMAENTGFSMTSMNYLRGWHIRPCTNEKRPILVKDNTAKRAYDSIKIWGDSITYSNRTDDKGKYTQISWNGVGGVYDFSIIHDNDIALVDKDGYIAYAKWSCDTKSFTVKVCEYYYIANPLSSGIYSGDYFNMSYNYDALKYNDLDFRYFFPNDLGNGWYKATFQVVEEINENLNTASTDLKQHYIVFKAKVKSDNKSDFGILNSGTVTDTIYDKEWLNVDKGFPDVQFVFECNNRLWGCSKDGHEIYCTKLGHMNAWNVYQGLSTDSWAATVGSDGIFTGGINFNGYPMFFKENSFIKVNVSSTGAHQYKETYARGVQKGSEKSMQIINERLYYKSANGICMYDGSLPVEISGALGGKKYFNAVAGTIDNLYYVSMSDTSDVYHLFVYDTSKGIWTKEDNTKALCFCKHDNDLYFINGDTNMIQSVNGTTPFELTTKESNVPWFVESGMVGYLSPDNKYVSKISLRIQLDLGSMASFYIEYDSSGVWEHKFNMNGNGIKTFTIPVIPRRCDHFRWKIKGTGNAKIYSISKTLEKGSDA